MKQRTIRIRMDCTPEQYAAISNAVWAVVNTAGLAGEWFVERDTRSDPAALNDAWKDSPDWT